MSHLDLLTTDLRPVPRPCDSCDNDATKRVGLYLGDVDCLKGTFCDACATRVQEQLGEIWAPKPQETTPGWCGFQLVVDPTMEPGTIDFKDHHGRLIGRLTIDGPNPPNNPSNAEPK